MQASCSRLAANDPLARSARSRGAHLSFRFKWMESGSASIATLAGPGQLANGATWEHFQISDLIVLVGEIQLVSISPLVDMRFWRSEARRTDVYGPPADVAEQTASS